MTVSGYKSAKISNLLNYPEAQGQGCPRWFFARQMSGEGKCPARGCICISDTTGSGQTNKQVPLCAQVNDANLSQVEFVGAGRPPVAKVGRLPQRPVIPVNRYMYR